MATLFSTPQQPSRHSRTDSYLQMTPAGATMASLGSDDADMKWLTSAAAQYEEDEGIVVSPFQDIFPKREMYENLDLSKIPLALFTPSMAAPLDTSSSNGVAASIELGSAFTPDSISPTSSISAASGSTASGMADLSGAFNFDASVFGQTTDLFSMPRPSTPVMEHRRPRLDVQATPEQSIRAPMNTLPTEGRSLSSSALIVPKEPQRSSTPPPLDRTLSFPQPTFQTPSYTPRKRKSTGSASTPGSSRSSASPSPPASGSGVRSSTSPSSSSPLQPRKTTHNMIEKRYRTNINDKIAALRDAVPSLRLMMHRMEREACGGVYANGGGLATGEGMLLDDAELASLEAEQHLLGGLAPAHKLNKATVLSKATEYIGHLERNNTALSREVGQLRTRIMDVEMMLMQHQQQQPQPAQQQRPTMGFATAGVW